MSMSRHGDAMAQHLGRAPGFIGIALRDEQGEFLAAEPGRQMPPRSLRAMRGAKQSATARKALSPAAWPNRSLTDLKWSMSTMIAASGAGRRGTS